MTAKERRLEAALVGKERQLLDAEKQLAWYFSHWLAAGRIYEDVHSKTSEWIRQHPRWVDSIFRGGQSLWHG